MEGSLLLWVIFRQQKGCPPIEPAPGYGASPDHGPTLFFARCADGESSVVTPLSPKVYWSISGLRA
jgi:hypothetical protein